MHEDPEKVYTNCHFAPLQNSIVIELAKELLVIYGDSFTNFQQEEFLEYLENLMFEQTVSPSSEMLTVRMRCL